MNGSEVKSSTVQLAQKWERSYAFSEREQQNLVALQRLIIEGIRGEPVDLDEYMESETSGKENSTPLLSATSNQLKKYPSPTESATLYHPFIFALPSTFAVLFGFYFICISCAQTSREKQRLLSMERNLARLNELKEELERLTTLLDELCSGHEKIRAKSIVMQSLGEGLLSRQFEYELLCKELENAIDQYKQISLVSSKCNPADAELVAGFSTERLMELGESIRMGIGSVRFLRQHPNYFEQAQYLNRYKQALAHGLALIRDRFIVELECLETEVKSGSSAICSLDDTNMAIRIVFHGTVMGDLLKLAWELGQLWPGEFDGTLIACVNCYFQLRHDLVLKWFKARVKARLEVRQVLECTGEKGNHTIPHSPSLSDSAILAIDGLKSLFAETYQMFDDEQNLFRLVFPYANEEWYQVYSTSISSPILQYFKMVMANDKLKKIKEAGEEQRKLALEFRNFLQHDNFLPNHSNPTEAQKFAQSLHDLCRFEAADEKNPCKS